LPARCRRVRADRPAPRARNQAPGVGRGARANESNKTNNSVSQAKEGEGDPPSIFSTNKTNNSVAHDGPRKRGAPKGNRNALKHGFRSGKRREFSSGLRNFLRRVDAMCKLAHAMASGGRAR